MEYLCLTLNLRQTLFQSLSVVCVFVCFFLTNTFFLRLSFDSFINLGIFHGLHFKKPKYNYIWIVTDQNIQLT